MHRPASTPRRVGRIRLFVTPWCRRAMTDAEWDTLRALDIDATVQMFADSARGPFTIRLGRVGFDPIEASGRTLEVALAVVVAEVAA